MEPYTIRIYAYVALGVIAEIIVSGGLIIAPVLLFIDMTVDLIRRRYNEFKKEQNNILDALKEK